MKKIGLLALPLVLAACGSGGVSMSKVAITATLGGGGVVVDRLIDAKNGTINGYSNVITQPTLQFNVLPGSLGVTFDSYTLQLQDENGALFSNVQYTRSMSFHVMGGWKCGDDTTTTYCDSSTKQPYGRTVTFGDADGKTGNIFLSEIGNTIVDYFSTTGECPKFLRADITLNGFDDNNKRITPITIDDANIPVTCNTKAGTL